MISGSIKRRHKEDTSSASNRSKEAEVVERTGTGASRSRKNSGRNR